MTAVATETTGGAAGVPSAPPPLSREQSGMEVNGRGRTLFVVWDYAAVLAPITRNDLYLRIAGGLQGGAAWREYRRHHPEVRDGDSQRLLGTAERWHFHREVDSGIEAGFLTEGDGGLAIGTCPPAHIPLESIGGTEGATAVLLADEGRAALEVLRGKEQRARQRSTAEGRRRLRASLEAVGQLYPIRRYRAGGEWIVVDGVEREEALREMGVEPRYVEVEGSALRALLERVHHEMVRTTKDESRTEAFLKGLAEHGVVAGRIKTALDDVADSVRLALREMPEPAKSPAPEEVERWRGLAAAGWSRRDIAERTGWPQTVVARRLDGTGRSRGLSERQTAILLLMRDRPAGLSATEAYSMMGLGEKRGGEVFPNLAKRGLIEKAGMDGQKHLYRLTDLGHERLAQQDL